MVRENPIRGEMMECKIINLLSCKGILARKNPDKYGMDVELLLEGNKTVLLEIEETQCDKWPAECEKPTYPSELFTMPIRKIKYFVSNRTKQNETLDRYLKENSTIHSIDEFYKLFDKSTKWTGLSDGKIRLYIKGSWELEHLCIVKSETIIKALNGQLTDQDEVKSRIEEMRKNLQNSYMKVVGNLKVTYGKIGKAKTRKDKKGTIQSC